VLGKGLSTSMLSVYRSERIQPMHIYTKNSGVGPWFYVAGSSLPICTRHMSGGLFLYAERRHSAAQISCVEW
jgi:hypothetical protein